MERSNAGGVSETVCEEKLKILGESACYTSGTYGMIFLVDKSSTLVQAI